jgi:hypothetical protein
MRRDKVWRPFLALFGGTAARSYVEVEATGIHARYGWLFDKRFAFSEIASVGRTSWPWWLGIGWRSNLVNLIGLTGSTEGAVEIRFRKRYLVWLLIPLPMRRLAITLEDPDGFVAALEKSRAGAAGIR